MANGFNLDDLNLSDILTHPVTLTALSALAGASRPIPTRFGVRRAGLSGGLEGALSGYGLSRQMEERRRKLAQERTLSELFGNKGYFAEKIPTGRQISKEVPTGEFGPTKETEPGDYPIGNVPQTRTETTPEMAPRLSEDKRRILASLPPSVQASTLGRVLTQEEKPIAVGRGGLAIKDPSQPTGYRIVAPAPVAETSPFAKPQEKDFTSESVAARRRDPNAPLVRIPGSEFAQPKHPTEGKTAKSIVEWRKTRTPENPEGDFSVLVPREDPLKRELTESQIQRNKAVAERARRERETRQGSVAYQEFLQFGGDPQDEEAYLDFLNRRKEGMEKQAPVRRGDVKEARQALAGVAESEAFKTADDEQKKQWLEESANGFGYTIVGDPLSRGYLFGIGKGKFDPSKIGLAPLQAKSRLQKQGSAGGSTRRTPTADDVLRKYGVQ